MNGELKFTIKIDDKREYKLDLAEMLKIDEANLDQQLADQPSQYVWCGTLSALSRGKRRRMEMDLEIKEAKFAQELREHAASSGEKFTEKSIADQLVMNKGLIADRRALIEAEEQESICDAAKEAFRHRKDCLVTIAADKRAASDTALRVGKDKE